MFLSIVIPIYNDEKFLEECLDSCLDQDITKDEYEIICVDDGSTDRTPEILRDYEQRYPNIHVITKQHGVKYGYGRDIGYRAAQGDYIWFVDHDDLVGPGAVDNLYSAAKENTDYDRIAFPYYVFFNQLTDYEKTCMKEGTLQPNDGDALLEHTLWSGIIRMSFLRQHDIWPHSKRIEAAAHFWDIDDFIAWGGDNICMEECFDCGMRTKLLSGRPFYHYRRHSESESMDLSKESLEKREIRQYNSGVLRAYLAFKLKEQYNHERIQNGHASQETTVAMILKLRRSISILANLSRKKWSAGIKQLQSKDIFWKHTPEEYTFSFREYVKTRSLKEKLSLPTYANYYTYLISGARWYRFLCSFERMTRKSSWLVMLYRKNIKNRIRDRFNEQL